MNTVAMLTCAPMGGYKSYSRGPSFALDIWLPDYDGVLYTTIPLKVAEIAEEARRRYEMDPGEVERRIRVIPRETVIEWTREGGTAGPWDMEHGDLAGAHLQFDEFHHYAPRTGEVERRRRWREWIAEIRHEGATIEFLTQDVEAIDKRLVSMVALRLELVNQETSREPFFGCQMGDWYELRSKALGYWCPCVWELEKRKVDRRWVETGHARRIYPRPRYYELYDSFAKPHRRQIEEADGEGEEGAEGEEGEGTEVINPNPRQWERRSWPGLVAWFLRRNWWHLVCRLAVVAALVWFFGLGGMTRMISEFTDRVHGMVGNQVHGVARDGQGGGGMGGSEMAPEMAAAPTAEVPETTEAEKLMALNPVLCRTDFDAEGLREYRAKDMPKVVLEREVLYAEIDALQDEVARLKETAARLVMVGQDGKGREYAVFESGRYYMVGDSLEETGYWGRTIEAIDRGAGHLVLDDASRVVLGGMRDAERRSVLGGLAGVGGPVSGGAGGQGGGGDRASAE